MSDSRHRMSGISPPLESSCPGRVAKCRWSHNAVTLPVSYEARASLRLELLVDWPDPLVREEVWLDRSEVLLGRRRELVLAIVLVTGEGMLTV